MLVVCTGLWIMLAISIFFATSYWFFMVISGFTGLVIGSTPAIARGYLGKRIPVQKRAEFFGFNTFVGRIAALFGPLIFGVVSSTAVGMRGAVLSIVPFFLVGFVFLVLLLRKESYEIGAEGIPDA